MVRTFRDYSFFNLLRKTAYVLVRLFGIGIQAIRKFRLYFFINCWVKNILGSVHVSTICMNVKFGKNVTLYPNTILEVSEQACLIVGDNFTLSYGALIASNYFIKMGNHVMIGEYTSIRDTTHVYHDCNVPYCRQTDKSEKIIIGNNVWIGKGCIILPGAVIEDGVIVGAHSVVKGCLKANAVYAGIPLRLIKNLPQQNEVLN